MPGLSIVARCCPAGGLSWRIVRIAVAKETREGETRVALVPELVGSSPRSGTTSRSSRAPVTGRCTPTRSTSRRARRSSRSPWQRADVVVSVNPLDASVDQPAAAGHRDGLVPADRLPRRVTDLRDGWITSFAMELVPRISRAQSMDALSSQALVAGYRCAIVAAGPAAPVLPAQHDCRRHGPAGRGRRARRRGGGPAGHRDREAARRRRQGVRRPRRCRRGDPVDGRRRDRARPRDARGLRRLRPGDDRGPRPAAARPAHAVHRRRRRADHHRRRSRAARLRCWSPGRWSSR